MTPEQHSKLVHFLEELFNSEIKALPVPIRGTKDNPIVYFTIERVFDGKKTGFSVVPRLVLMNDTFAKACDFTKLSKKDFLMNERKTFTNLVEDGR